MLIRLAFDERWLIPMLLGTKSCHALRYAAGEPGDTFEAFGLTLRLLNVQGMTGKQFSREFWLDAGYGRLFHSERHLLEWLGNHWREELLWVHWFELDGEAPPI